MSTISGQGGSPGETDEIVPSSSSLAHGTSVDSNDSIADSSGGEVTSPLAEVPATTVSSGFASVSGAAGPSDDASSSGHHESTDGTTIQTSATTAFKDKIDPFMKGSLKRKQKKSRGSSRYRSTSDGELQSPSMEDSMINENEEELDFEEEEYESLEEGEKESDKEEGTTNLTNMEWATGDSKESNVKETKEKSKKKDDEDEDEDGEVNSDDDLEEGEVKEDDSDRSGSDEEANGQKKLTKKIVQTQNPNNQAKTSICRFFAKGQCTWGLNCRFLHLAAPVVTLPLKLPNQRGFPYQVGLNPTGLHPTGMHPTGAHPTGVHPPGPQAMTHAPGAHPTGPHPTGHHPIPRPPLNRHQAAALAGTTIHPPHPPPSSSSQQPSSNTDSAWVRGLRNAKEMLVKANKRKEEESDFEKKFNTNPEDEGTSHSKHSRESPESGDYGDRRSPHNYHSRDREKRSHREATRRDYNREVRDTRDTREREPKDTRERDNVERESREDYWNNSEYERRRRLAFESAPWNEEQSPPPPPASNRGNVRPREAAEMYRDPWRRSKSPPGKWAGGRKADVSTASKRSHSMSSISDSESGSGLSGSESISGSEGSLTGSDVSYSDASQVSGRSPREDRHKSKSGKSSSKAPRDANKPRPKQTVAEQPPHHSRDRGLPPLPSKSSVPVRERIGSAPINRNRSTRNSIDEASGSGPRKKSGPASPPPPVPKPRRDSWSDSDSASMSGSDSSVYSCSETGESDDFSGASGGTPLEDDRRSKGYRSSNSNRRDLKPHPSSNRQIYDSSSRRPPPQSQPPPSSSHHASNPKRMKMSAASTSTSSRENNSMKHRHSSTLSNDDLPASTHQHHHHQQSMMSSKKHAPSSPNDGPKKNPIKMTFKKKHSSLKTDRVITAKLNGGKSDEESGEDEEELDSHSGDRHQKYSSPRTGDDEEGDALNEHEDKPVKRNVNEHHSSLSEDDEVSMDGGSNSDDHRSRSNRQSRGQQQYRQPTSTRTTPPSSSSSTKVTTSKDSSTRREHLLKQLEAVEAMIAKKKAKLN